MMSEVALKEKDSSLDWRSVTDLVHDVVNPGIALARHANREGLEGRGLYSQERKERMEGGTGVHLVLESLRRGEPINLDDYPLHRRLHVQGVLNWQRRFERKILATEIDVLAEHLRIKGRIDYLRACQKQGCLCQGEGLIIGDLKVGQLSTYIQAHLQISGYHYIWVVEEHRPEILCGGEVLCVNALGDFAIWQVLARPEDFLKAAEWHAQLIPLRRRVEEQKGANR